MSIKISSLQELPIAIIYSPCRYKSYRLSEIRFRRNLELFVSGNHISRQCGENAIYLIY